MMAEVIDVFFASLTCSNYMYNVVSDLERERESLNFVPALRLMY
jgi:hypothetical protein